MLVIRKGGYCAALNCVGTTICCASARQYLNWQLENSFFKGQYIISCGNSNERGSSDAEIGVKFNSRSLGDGRTTHSHYCTLFLQIGHHVLFLSHLLMHLR